MRNAAVEALIERTLFEHSNVRVRVEAQARGDANAPAWSTQTTGIEVRINDASVQERQPEQWNYAHPLTHVAFCRDNEHLQVGYRLVETHRQTSSGQWKVVAAADAETYLIMALFRIPGLPYSSGVRRLHLWCSSPMRGRDS